MTVTLLGTGTSTGVPVIGCQCAVCQSDDPRDKRTRTSCRVQVDGLEIIIDTGPDFRKQSLREDLRRVDAVLFTHHHFDHIVGMDDLRPFFFDSKASIPCYARPNTAEALRHRFSYIFGPKKYPSAANLTLESVQGTFEVSGRYEKGRRVSVTPIDAFHGELPLYGYRIGRFAFLTDTSHIPEHSFAQLNDLDVLVLDALRHKAHPTHFTIAEAVQTARRIGARQTYFVHMTHSVPYSAENASLPDGINLGYDGLSFEVNC